MPGAGWFGTTGRTAGLVLAGSCLLFAVLWTLANFSPAPPEILYAFVPLVLLWTAACIFWGISRARRTGQGGRISSRKEH
jgi:hypothetical protein